jgi:hypothetical protein
MEFERILGGNSFEDVGALDGPKNRIHPYEITVLNGFLSATYDMPFVGNPWLHYSWETVQPVRDYMTSIAYRIFGPFADFVLVEGFDAVKIEEFRASISIRLDGGDERNLVFRASANLAACSFTP